MNNGHMQELTEYVGVEFERVHYLMQLSILLLSRV